MDWRNAPVGPPQGVQSAGYPTRLHPETRQAGEAPAGRTDCIRPGAAAQHGRGAVRHIRAGFLTVLIWRTTRPRCPSRSGDPQRGDCWQKGGMGARGGFEELLRKSRPRLASPVRATPRRGSAPDQSDPALVESRGIGGRSVTPSEMGTPQGGSISVLLSNVYLHYALDLWFERVAKPRLRGEAYLVRYIDDFVVCFQFREDALRLQEVLRKRLGKFGLTLEPTKTKLVEFGRFAHRHASRHGRKRPETIYFLGFTLYCTRNLKGNFKVGMRTEKSRLRRSLMSLCDQMRQTRHLPIQEQVDALNLTLRGHYAYYGVAGNIRALQRVHRFVERYWRKMLCSRSWAGRHLTWAAFNRLKERVPLLRPRLRLPYRALQALSAVNPRPKSVVQEICTLRSVGGGGRRPPPPTRWAVSNGRPYRKEKSLAYHLPVPRCSCRASQC